MRLIDADALIPRMKAIRKNEFQIYGKAFSHVSGRYLNEVEEAPTVDTGKDPPHTRGEWIQKWWRPDGLVFNCSVCGSQLSVDDGEMNFLYCPYCGTKMEGGVDEAD